MRRALTANISRECLEITASSFIHYRFNRDSTNTIPHIVEDVDMDAFLAHFDLPQDRQTNENIEDRPRGLPFDPVRDAAARNAAGTPLSSPIESQKIADSILGDAPRDQVLQPTPLSSPGDMTSSMAAAIETTAARSHAEPKYGPDNTFAYHSAQHARRGTFDSQCWPAAGNEKRWALKIMNAMAETKCLGLPGLSAAAEVWGDTGNMAKQELAELINDPNKPIEVERKTWLLLVSVVIQGDKSLNVC